MKLPGTEYALGKVAMPIEAKEAALKKGAAQFEGLLIRELVKAMRKSTPLFGEGQGKVYSDMFDSALSDHLAGAGGFGLAPVLERSLSAASANAPGATGGGARTGHGLALHRAQEGIAVGGAGASYGVQAYKRSRGRPVEMLGAPLSGATGRLQSVAKDMMMKSASRWSKHGVLRPSELSSQFETPAGDGEGTARFNVLDAGGYSGHPKCNLFALEAARKGGFQVPVVPRGAGWGFPSADEVTRMAAQGELQWGKVVTGASAADLEGLIEGGQGAFLFSGSGQNGQSGHMALVERVREVKYDSAGSVRQVVFDGWEARTQGAQYLSGRTWNVQGQHGGHMVRNGFQNIELIQLRATERGAVSEQPTQKSAPKSLLDIFPSSSNPQQPIQRMEDDS